MKSFFKFTLATILGVLISSILFFVTILIIISAATSKEVPKLKDNTILVAQFSGPITDRASDDPFSAMLAGNVPGDGVMGLDQILKDIRKAKSDDNISGIFLRLGAVPAGMATVEEIRDALLDFKESGKFIYAHADYYTQKAYYLATVADSIFLTPEGEIPFIGLSSQAIFLKKALEKLGVDVQVVRHGSFKGAVEPFIREDLSDENREQIEGYVGALWDQMVKGISEERNIPVEKLQEYADNAVTIHEGKAVELGMIDGEIYYDEMLSLLKEKTGVDEKDDLQAISLKKYKDVPASDSKEYSSDRIAVIYAMGTVTIGDAGEGSIGSDRIAKAIRKARRDDKVKAIVFRVNSGGGSSLASEVIYREVKLAAETKPVVASMGNMAASGGYYIVCPADTIIASENTLTGSIGVFGLLPNMQELMNDKLGITSDVVKTNKMSDMGSVFRPMTAEERELMQYSVDNVYNSFVTHVAESRGLTYEQVDAIGQGHVWAGKDAIEIGLIDMFGGLERSIEVAAEMAGLENYRVTSLPKLEDPLTQLMNQLSGDVRMKMIRKELGADFRYYQMLKEIREMEGVQARIPYEIQVH